MNMTETVFKAPKSKRCHRPDTQHWSPSPKKRRTKDDFYSFCNIVLAYTQYESMRHEELRENHNTSPLDSSSSTAESFTSDSAGSSHSLIGHDHDHDSHDDSQDGYRIKHRSGEGDDSWELVTCFCMKPFAGRPMIECSECETWIHLSCAKIRKSNIPDEFICQRCRDAKFTTRKSNRIRSDKKLVDA